MLVTGSEMFSLSSLQSFGNWMVRKYAEPLDLIKQILRVVYVVFAFCLALFLGALKALLVGPVAALLMIVGNIGVIIWLFPVHVFWTVYTIIKTHYINAALKCAFLLALPLLLGLWLGLSVFGSVLVGVGYGVFTPWISTFEAFREKSEAKKFLHSFVDGTWGTIKGSCTVVRDFADICFHSYPLYLKELREIPDDQLQYSIRLRDVPACIFVALMGLIVDIPLFTTIALIKSPYMLFKGWQRLVQDLISREGPFLEVACVPIAGLSILLWPLVVVGSIVLAIVSSIFVGLYGSVIVYQERSFKRGVAFVIAVVAEFDEYTNDYLYLREGSLLPKPRYRKRKITHSGELPVGKGNAKSINTGAGSSEAPVMLVPGLDPSRTVKESIQEVKMVQIWEEMMESFEQKGKELLDVAIITPIQLIEWLRAKVTNQETVELGLPSYSFLCTMLHSITAGSSGFLLGSGIEINHLNCPPDRLLDWLFHPIMVLMEQIKVMKLNPTEVNLLKDLVLFPSNTVVSRIGESSSQPSQDVLRYAQIQAISRRLVGIIRSVSKFPTYRRRYRHVIKLLLAYSLQRERFFRSNSNTSVSSEEIVAVEV